FRCGRSVPRAVVFHHGGRRARCHCEASGGNSLHLRCSTLQRMLCSPCAPQFHAIPSNLHGARLVWPHLLLMSTRKRNVGILIFPNVEVLDIAGPYEVFSRTRTVPGVDSRRDEAIAPFLVFTVARNRGPVTATGGLVV